MPITTLSVIALRHPVFVRFLSAADDLRGLGASIHTMFTQSADVDLDHLSAIPQPFRDIVRGCYGVNTGMNQKDPWTAQRIVAALDLPSPPEAIVNEFKLTPRELRVLFAIVEVGGVPDVAEVLGVSTETVKTHLGRLFEKTRTSRQADLVKLVAAFSNPLLR